MTAIKNLWGNCFEPAFAKLHTHRWKVYPGVYGKDLSLEQTVVTWGVVCVSCEAVMAYGLKREDAEKRLREIEASDGQS